MYNIKRPCWNARTFFIFLQIFFIRGEDYFLTHCKYSTKRKLTGIFSNKGKDEDLENLSFFVSMSLFFAMLLGKHEVVMILECMIGSANLSWLMQHKEEMVLCLDLFGTAIFAITGALRGFRCRLDFLGVMVLASAVGVGGGMFRDVFIGQTPVAAFQNGIYLMICAVAGAVMFYLAPRIGDEWNFIPLCDAIGLGVFTAIGCEKAASIPECGRVAIILCGVMTAVGGGIIRDVFSMRVPAVLKSDFYATASLLGGILFIILITWLPQQIDYFGRFCIVSSVVLLIRLCAMHFKFRLPVSHTIPSRERWRFHRKHMFKE